MTKFKKSAVSLLSLLCAACLFTGTVFGDYSGKAGAGAGKDGTINKVSAPVETDAEEFYDENVVYKLPDTVSDDQEISLIVDMGTQSVLDSYNENVSGMTLSEYASSSDARNISRRIATESAKYKAKLSGAGISYSVGETYDTIFSGFEIRVRAKDFAKVSGLLSDATVIVGEEYEPAAVSEVVTNEVDVYETGIFDSSDSEYQGDGVVVAILDTGLDYTHTAFSVDNFTTTNEAFTLQSVSGMVGNTVAAGYNPGLTGEDVYVSKKVPYAYDYGDKDSDVFPLNSDHGTHVAGIIAGKDDVITGVAPNAQLAIMKVFSDYSEGAKTSAILAALNDCVKLGVDVINMSLGTSCGFSREVDEENVNEIYDSIKAAGISLIAAASNDYNATFNSEKNGSNGLTSNPDSGTVGSPGTYDASLAVASVDGVKTPYLLYNDQIIYFNEASTSDTETKDFVDDILNTLGPDVNSHDFEYVTIPGVGRSSDYTYENSFYQGKIVLVRRGTTSFEDKVRVALQEKGAAGIIIYNNVSGTISMSVGADMGAVCSISQDDGELLAAQETGIIRISRDQTAGPFMSDFSSWGPTSDLKIKPEITAHGGEIYSSVPGQGYDRMSGTSMAAPNMAGAAALIRQYVRYSGVFGSDVAPTDVTALVNQLVMSTADIVYNKNGLPYAVRKQGAGLVNISKATSSASYITTYDTDGNKMEKTKLELGDDKSKSGVYEMKFDINNVSGGSVTYDLGSIVMTEGVSTTYTGHGDTTVTMDGYLLSGAAMTVTGVDGGSQDGNSVTVNGHGTATVSVRITLSDEDKKYMDESFAHGMYVEGFITLDAVSGTDVDMNIPMLAFYGDWTEAPIFDEEYYDTNPDEINDGLDPEDKLMADAYATRAIGGLYDDYILTLGSYAFTQDPASTQIAASKEHIAISNQQDGASSAVNSLEYIYAGLLRNVKEATISVVEDSTGREIFSRTEYNQRKSFNNGGSIIASAMEVEFSALEQNLKNNTQYTVTVTAYIDYGEKAEQKNVRNTFSFPLFVDFEAPTVTDVAFRTEYDRTTRETTYYADLSIYDNHYAMAVQAGQVTLEGNGFMLSSFGKYFTPVYSSFNSTSTVTIELTDYIEQIKQSDGFNFGPDGSLSIAENNNSFIAVCYDYALNSSMFEIRLPDDFLALAFTQDEIALSPNETLDISSVLNMYPSDSWIQMLEFSSEDTEIAEVINQTILAKQSGTTTVTATGYDADGNPVSDTVTVRVLSEGDEGYQGGYTVPEVNNFTLTGYTVNKAYYSISSSEREIGVTGGTYDFGGDYNLSMYPSESVTLSHTLDSYFPDRTAVTYRSGNARIATVTEDGTIVAQEEGTTIVTVTVTFDGRNTLYSERITITVKDPFTTNSIYLMSYRGLGGKVEIPDDRGITTIYSYAFSGYEYVPKDLENGDVINDEDPLNSKPVYIGEDTITEIVIPEGVTDIQQYAFAGLTALEKVTLPSTLNRIGMGAFYGCTSLKEINLENVQFVNKEAFRNTALTDVDLDSAAAIGDYAFADSRLGYLDLPASCQSLGIGAFYGNDYLTDVQIGASRIKVGTYVFAECPMLVSVNINASVISAYAFYNCTQLRNVTLGRDVSVIGEYAFAGTAVSSFSLSSQNTELSLGEGGALVYKGEELILVAPNRSGNSITVDAQSISNGAFAGNTRLFSVNAPNATSVGAYAFANCTNLYRVTMPKLETIGDYAFFNTGIVETPELSAVTSIGAYAFAYTDISAATIANDAQIGEGAFSYCMALERVKIGNNVTIGAAAFFNPVVMNLFDPADESTLTNFSRYYTAYTYTVENPAGGSSVFSYYRYNFDSGVVSSLLEVRIGTGAQIGEYAFAGSANLTSLTLGSGAQIGDYAFFNARRLQSVDLFGALSVGESAFSGTRTQDFSLTNNSIGYAFEYEYVNGELTPVAYKYSSVAPQFASADLSSLTQMGAGAFAFNDALSSVTFGSTLTEIPGYAFAYCTSLAAVDLPAQLSSIGEYAFMGTSLTAADLSSADSVGAYAFSRTDIGEVTLKNGARIGEGAFAYCYGLAKADNLANVASVGGYAFAGTALTSLDLAEVTYIGDFAFAESAVTSVSFGDKLVSLGENPFYGCAISTFGKMTDVTFNGSVIGQELTETYDVSSTVRVIGGVLYQSVPNGLELVSYPLAKQGTDFTVEEGTVRLAARAFAGSQLQTVTLPQTLRSVGDKAFYGCADLRMVVFKSYEAPVLEEEYDTSYATESNVPFTENAGGLGIVDYYMWNVGTGGGSNYFYGANFVDYIGHNDGKLVMVRPSNGQNYGSFIFEQYFGVSVAGSPAAMQNTLDVIALIAQLPDSMSVTLNDEAAIVAARAAYDAIGSTEQQSLVSNIDRLTAAESALAYLKTREPTPEPDPVPEPSAVAEFFRNNMVGLIIAGVLLLAVAGLTAWVILLKKNNKRNA